MYSKQKIISVVICILSLNGTFCYANSSINDCNQKCSNLMNNLIDNASYVKTYKDTMVTCETNTMLEAAKCPPGSLNFACFIAVGIKCNICEQSAIFKV